MNVPGKLGGSDPLVGWLNKLRDAVLSSKLTSVVNGRMTVGPGGTSLVCLAASSGGSQTSVVTAVERFRIRTGGVLGDYLACETWDGTTGGGVTVNIAKNPKCRHVSGESIAGTSYTYTYSSDTGYEDGKRVASDGTNSEKQVVIPVYIIGDDIYATKPTRGSGVSVSGTPLEYLDINADGRAWARKWDQS